MAAADGHVRLFAVLWALAHLVHVLRHAEPGSLVTWAVVVAALLLAARPDRGWSLATLATVQVAHAALLLPLMPNHYLLMAFGNLGLLVVLAHRWNIPTALARDWFAYLRWVLAIAYGAAAVAKLNTGFFSEYTCAATLFYDSARAFGAPQLPVTVEALLPYLTATAELGVVVLLLVPATRTAGVALAVGLHLVMAISPTAFAGLGFTAAVFAFVVPFMSPALMAYLLEHVDRWMEAIAGWRRDVRRLVGVLAAGVYVAAAGGHIPLPEGPFFERGWWLTAPVIAAVGGGILMGCWVTRSQRPAPLVFRVRSPVAVGVVALVALTAAAPYLGSRTLMTFSMYSNLETARGESNHFLIPRLPREGSQDDLVTIHESDNPRLMNAANHGAQVTWHELRRELAEHPEDALVYERQGEVFDLDRAADDPDLASTHPVWHRLVAHRDVSPEPLCRW